MEKLQSMYDDMTEYQKKFLTDDYVDGLKKYTSRMNDLVKEQEEAAKKDTDTADKDSTESGDSDK